MTRLRRAKMLFFVEIFLQLFHVILAEKTDFDGWSDDDKRSFFGIANSSIPDVGYGKIVRSRRSITSVPSITILVKFDDMNFTTTLDMVTDKFLADDTITGIWKAKSHRKAFRKIAYTPAPEIFDTIGPFEFFQNIDDGSAVTRFDGSTHRENFEGILKQKYIIKTWPLWKKSEWVAGVSKCPFGKNFAASSKHGRKKCSDFIIWRDPEDSPSRYGLKQSLPHGNHKRTRQRQTNSNDKPTTVYPKLLIAPDYAWTSATKNIVDAVKRLIVQFNSVDVLYRQLREPKVRLSVVGIIIPQDEHVTPYMVPSGSKYLNGTATMRAAKKYFRLREISRNFNNYDILIIITEKLVRKNGRGRKMTINRGLAMKNSSCDKGVAIATYDDYAVGVYVVAQQIARVFGINFAAADSKKCRARDGYIMVSKFRYVKTLRWSECSQQSFKSIFRSTTTRCMKDPPYRFDDSVKRLPGTWLGLAAQCLNKFHRATGYCFLEPGQDCQTYGCYGYGGECWWLGNEPLEGTIMAGQRCINQTLVPIKYHD